MDIPLAMSIQVRAIRRAFVMASLAFRPKLHED
jgi:hypothetical protein